MGKTYLRLTHPLVREGGVLRQASWDVTGGHLCIKGRFGVQHVQARGEDET